MRRLRPSKAAVRFSAGDGLLLLNRESNALFAYNNSALDLWRLIEGNISDSEIGERFASLWDIPPAQAARDASAAITEWAARGLIEGMAGERTGTLPPEPPPSVRTVLLDQQQLTERVYSVRGIAIKFAFGPDVETTIHPLFHHLETPAAPTCLFEVRRVAIDRLAFVVNGNERLTTADLGQLIGAVWQAVLEQAHPGIQWLALMHGGAVSRGDRAIALCGPSGSGKSTLIAALAARGFRYRADDMVTLSHPDGLLVPLPLPQSIKPGSFDALTPYVGDLEGAGREYRTKGMNARLLKPAADAWDLPAVPLKSIIFPTYCRGAEVERRQLPFFEVIERLLRDRIWIGNPITETRVANLLDWLRATPCYAITYPDLESGIRLVEDIAT